jgi:hypothetical protein
MLLDDNVVDRQNEPDANGEKGRIQSDDLLQQK